MNSRSFWLSVNDGVSSVTSAAAGGGGGASRSVTTRDATAMIATVRRRPQEPFSDTYVADTATAFSVDETPPSPVVNRRRAPYPPRASIKRNALWGNVYRNCQRHARRKSGFVQARWAESARSLRASCAAGRAESLLGHQTRPPRS